MRRRQWVLAAAAVAGLGVAAIAAPSHRPRTIGVVQPVPPRGAVRAGRWSILLDPASQTLASLRPVADPGFDFAPWDRRAARSGAGHAQLGDLHLRVRAPGGEWRDFSTSRVRTPLRVLPRGRGDIAAADITPTLGKAVPLRVERRWAVEGDGVALRFTLTNTGVAPVEIGGLGLPMVFNNIITGHTLEQAHTRNSFADPYIGRDAGYVQVTRLNGGGPALLVLPEPGTPLEAYTPIPDARKGVPAPIFSDATPRSQTFEGFYDWQVASAGFAEREWKGAGTPWNAPTSITLKPGESRRIGVRLVASPTIRGIEPTLMAHGRPVAVGVPGYVVAPDLDAALFVHAPSAIASLSVWPEGALDIVPAGAVAGGWQRLSVRGRGWGPVRLTIGYRDGSAQTVSYFVTKPARQTVADLGRFATTRQLYEDAADPFRRAPAILSYDHEANRIVTQEPRVWIAGMSDEGGAGAWVAAMAKQLDNPVPAEVAVLERVVDETVWGKLQHRDGPEAYGVVKSLFFYDPKRFPTYYDPARDWSSWTSWKPDAAADVGRSFNYPHVAIGYWVLYRLARDHVGLVTHHDWRWYLDHARRTVDAMVRLAPYYAQFGQMEGDVFVEILADLKREGMTAEAAALEAQMKARADHWRTLAYPFGSEMAWDSTGQAEVYAWMRHFGYQKQAAQTREVILGYDPTIPSWGYNGNARRYWDFLYGGKLPRIERQIHHYGSTANAVPLLAAFRADPSDMHLLRVGYGGIMGGITNIDRDGFGSAAFHAWPDQMRFDPYTGDYGMGFFGHAYAAASYLVKDPTFGWLGYGGNVSQVDGQVRIEPRDSARSRLFVAPAGLWLTLDAGKIAAATFDPRSGTVTLTLEPGDATTPRALVCATVTVAGAARYAPTGGTAERGCTALPLTARGATLTLTRRG